MSAGVSDQRMKGQGNQVSNGPKEQLGAGEGAGGSEDFESWRTQQQQNTAAHTPYGATTVPISSATDLYSMSTAAGYYGSGGTYPYHSYGVGDGTWSNGTDPMTFLSGYAHDSYSMDGMFGPSTFSTATAFGQPNSFNYFHNNGDYSTWGNQLGQRKQYDDYYREPQNMYHTMHESTMKGVEQAMQNLDLKGQSNNEQSKDALGQPKKLTWASIASQPAKPQLSAPSQGLKKKGPGMPPGPMIPGKHNMDIGTWDTSKSTPPQLPIVTNSAPKNIGASLGGVRPGWTGPPARPQPAPRPGPPMAPYQPQALMAQHMPAAVPTVPAGLLPPGGAMPLMMAPPAPTHPVLDELRGKNNYNPTDFDLTAPNARFFVIKSYSEDDIHRSIKYEIWCSTEHGNKRLDQAFRERDQNGMVYLFFSVNGSGHFCGMAQMVSSVDYSSNSSVWSQDKWKGQFKVHWIYVKDVPNVQLRHIRLENNENKPVTNSRDTQEVPHSKGLQVLRILHSYRHSTSIFDDFVHYEKRQEEEDSRKVPDVPPQQQQQQQQQQHQQQHQQQQHQQQQQPPNREGREHHRGGGRPHDRGGEDNHRPMGGHRNNDHGKDRGDNNRGRGRGGRNMN